MELCISKLFYFKIIFPLLYWQGRRRMGWGQNAHTLLMRMETSTTTMEISMVVPQKAKNRPIL
jgi:hypothetical protein